MASIFFSLSLVLRYSTVSPPRHERDPHLYVYSSAVELDGSRMTVMIPLPMSAFVPDGTRAQVMGPADVVGDTIFMRPSPSVFPSEQPVDGGPFVFFRASVAVWDHGVFSAVIAGGAAWPPSVEIMCSYDPDSDHLRHLKALPPSTVVVIAGNVTNVDADILEIAVHDLGLYGEALPCNANSLTGLPLRPAQRRALCHWFQTYYPLIVDGNAAAAAKPALGPAMQGDTPVSRVTGVQPAVEGDESVAPPAESTLAHLGAQRVEGAVASFTGQQDVSTPEAAVTRSPRDTPTTAGPHLVDVSTPNGDSLTGASTPDAHQSPGDSGNDDLAIRQALEALFALRDEGPIGQSPVDWGTVLDAREGSNTASPSSPGDAGPMQAAVHIVREVIDLTAETSDDEAATPVCKPDRVIVCAERLAKSRVVSCTF